VVTIKGTKATIAKTREGTTEEVMVMEITTVPRMEIGEITKVSKATEVEITGTETMKGETVMVMGTRNRSAAPVAESTAVNAG
jgi:hypothetical protein